MSGFGAVLVLLGLLALVFGGLYGTAKLLSVGSSPLSVEPFTGGLPPVEHAVSRYHVRWYAVTMLFLAFDMEMIFMYPWAVVFADFGLTAFLDMLVFIALLAAGITYAWGMGGLEWE